VRKIATALGFGLKQGRALVAGPIARASALSLAIRLAGLVLSFAQAVLTARLLGSTGYGTVATILSAAQLLSTAAMFGFGPLAVREIAASLDCAAVVTFTSSGHTALAIARERPASPILGLTPDTGTARFLALVWGVHSLRSAEVDTMPDMMEIVRDCVARSGIARAGDVVVITAGIPLRTPGTTNLIRVATI